MTRDERQLSDEQQPLPLPATERRWGLLLALQFLTVAPISLPDGQGATGDTAAASAAFDLSPALPWFPLVGALIGVLLAALDWALTPVLALPVRDALLLAVSALVTGMLHLDGFVDCCDALLGARSVERRLAILRDSRVGAYGALGGALLLIARFAALGALTSQPLRALALIVAPTLGRWGIVYAVTRFPYVRQQGVGSAFQATARHLVAATIVMLAVLALLVLAAQSLFTRTLPQAAALLVLLILLALVITLAWASWASKRLGGGLTGDTYGALNELVELGVLILAPPMALLVLHLFSLLR